MIRDCRADRPEGWSYFLIHYVPVIRRLIAHYAPERTGDTALVERAIGAMRRPESGLFDSLEPAPERWFIAGLRQKVLEEIAARSRIFSTVAGEMRSIAAASSGL